MNFDKSNYSNIFVLLIISLFLRISTVSGQQSNSLYYMDRIPQSAQLNPGIQPKCGFYLGLPGFSSLEVNAGNNALGFLDVFKPNMVGDSLGYRKDVLNKLDKNILLFGDLRQDWLSFGFRVNESYFTFAISERIETSGILPKDLIRLTLNGNMQNFSDPAKSYNFDLSGLGLNATWYREYALGYSKEINENLTFGLRARLLFGKANITTTTAITLPQTDMSLWKANANLELKSSVPTLHVTYKSDGKIDSTELKQNNSDALLDKLNSYNPTNNKGIGLDFGIVLKPISILTFSASILDIGYIHWKNNIHSLSYNGPVTFKGLPASVSDTIDRMQALVDTFKNLKYRHNQDDYITTLSPKLYVGAHLQLVKFLGVGFLSRFQMMESSIRSQYTLSLNLTSAKFIGTTLSYTLADGMTDNFGIAMNLNFGPLQWYISSDRIPLYWAANKDPNSSPYIPENYKNFNIHTGINLVFGYVRNRKLIKDKPLVAL